MSALRIALCSLLLLLATVSLVAQGTFTPIEVPGAQSTLCLGINTAGDIVGMYIAAEVGHGFLFSGGTYTTIDYLGIPGSLTGINDMGEIVGSDYLGEGFLYDVASQTFSTISFPGASKTYPYAINNAGTVAGYFIYGNNATSGFQLSGSSYEMINPPGASDSYIYGISSSGELVGGVDSPAQTIVNFIFRHQMYDPIFLPKLPSAIVQGVNPAGTTVVGNYLLPSGTGAAFVHHNKHTLFFQYPGPLSTAATAINAEGVVVGFVSFGGNYFGFTWTPSASASEP